MALLQQAADHGHRLGSGPSQNCRPVRFAIADGLLLGPGRVGVKGQLRGGVVMEGRVDGVSSLQG
jgi:hypothetical protein